MDPPLELKPLTILGVVCVGAILLLPIAALALSLINTFLAHSGPRWACARCNHRNVSLAPTCARCGGAKGPVRARDTDPS